MLDIKIKMQRDDLQTNAANTEIDTFYYWAIKIDIISYRIK